MTVPAAEPLYFGPADRPLFGWLHRPAQLAEKATGLVICNPFGYEAVCAHRTLRHMAEAAACAGIPTLRFDYDGTGNSAGDDLDEHRVESWIDSILYGISSIKQHTGVAHVAILAVRLGATLALHAARQRNDVAGIVMIAPLGCKQYLRELRALQLAKATIREVSDSETQEAAGYLLTKQTRSTLEALDSYPQSINAPIFVMERDDIPSNAKHVAALHQLSPAVQIIKAGGYGGMMLDPHQTIVPIEAINKAIQWLSALPTQSSNPAKVIAPHNLDSCLPQHALIPNKLVNGLNVSVREEIISSYAQCGLFGIRSQPENVASTGHIVLLLNAGSVHHIGPNRMYVTLARQLAAVGHTVIRFDLSGIGDSRARSTAMENIVYSSYAINDIFSLINWSRAEHPEASIHLVGLCSGAYHGLKAALVVPVRSVIAINPLTFFWKDGMSLEYADHRVAADIIRYRKTALQAKAWLKMLRGQVNIWTVLLVLWKRTITTIDGAARNIARCIHIPLNDDLGAELQQISRNGAKVTFIFADTDPGHDQLRRQAGNVLKKLLKVGQLTINIVDNADHTFIDRPARESLLELLARTLSKL